MKVNDFIKRLERAGIFNAQQEAVWLISDALGVNNSEIFARENFSDYEISKIENLISRRVSGEPLQYIMGEASFYGRDFKVGNGVLIPRHDTETLIEAVKKYFEPSQKLFFLDWGTGSGCIAITILLEYENSFAFMLENNPKAINYAKKNSEIYNIQDRAKIIKNFGEIEFETAKFDFIISNPPYIPSNEISDLMPVVKNYEPLSALDGGDGGMDFYKLIISQAEKILKRNGYIIFETGNLNQVNALKNLSENFIFENEFFDDGIFPRCLILRKGCD